jgi:imidazole glycerol-phosphate synthase subunit HisF
MNKIRLIPVLFIKNGFIVRSENFTKHKIIGNVVNQVRRYNQWDVDELIFIDISRTKIYDSKRDDHKIERVKSLDDILEVVSSECLMPLTFGGGIRDLNTIKKYINNGADKVVINSLIHMNPSEVKKAISLFGSQAIVASLDYKVEGDQVDFYIKNGTEKLKTRIEEMITLLENLGVGEIFLNSITKDGTGEGYDLEIIKRFVESTQLPVVGCGGAALDDDFVDLAEIKGISGVAAGNLFHFTENVYPRAKKKLIQKELNFRTYNY